MILQRLGALDGALPIPEVVAITSEPGLLVTRRMAGDPLSWEWASDLRAVDIQAVAQELGSFLVRLHGVTQDVFDELPVVQPTAQADTDGLRARFHHVVDAPRAAIVQEWCAWVDDVLHRPHLDPPVLVHGDLHGYNQLWDRPSARLVAVVDFEETGPGRPSSTCDTSPATPRPRS